MSTRKNPAEVPTSVAPAEDESATCIFWQDIEGVYKPFPRPLFEFLSSIQPANKETEFQHHAPLLVFMDHGCVEAMEAHARSDVVNEQAGIICGHSYLDPGGQLYVVVTSALPADTTNGPVHFRFHESSWEQLWSRIENGSDLLGWYHSHPGMGVFLSATDLRTQQLYFAAPWQIAVVLDPVSQEMAIFHGVDGRRVPQENLAFYSAR